ncbi:7517_t:CDS:2 [Entrophospora sp. SA101]|nr:8700_t:CDS:2 [Entrophospora sp. SA101]CAJ0837837.1 7517_t:CDS:2 [Entrophospora sp. SA101]
MEDNNTSDDKYDFEAEDLFGAGGSSEDDSEEERAENLHSKVADIQIFNAFLHTKTNKTYCGENESNYCKGVRFATASSIRWRYNKRKSEDGENEIIEKETNTKLVKWSDGSKTLHIGKESYSLNSYELGRPRYIAIAHKKTKQMKTQYIDFSTIERLTKEYKEQQKKRQKAQKSSNALKINRTR